MKKVYLFFIILLISLFFSPNGFTRNDTQYGLPFGVNACLGKGTINDLAFYPDGTELAIASDSGIWKYNIHTGEENIVSKDWVEILELSADGKTLASVETFWQPLAPRAPSDKVQLLDTDTHSTWSIPTEHRNGINALALSEDGSTLARLCLPFDPGSSHDKASKVLQNFLRLADYTPIFIDFSVILML